MRRKRQSAILAPDLPRDLAQSTTSQIVDNATFSTVALTDCDLSQQTGDDVLFEYVRCKRVDLRASHLKLAQLLDVVFDTCDFSTSTWQKAHVQRVEMLGCRLTGAKWTDARFEHTRWSQCNGEYAQFWTCTLESAIFEGCMLREASFEGSNLAGVVFRNCDLSRADFRGTKLAGADLRGSIVSDMQVGLAELRGAIIDPHQAVQLAGLLGIVVQPLDDA